MNKCLQRTIFDLLWNIDYFSKRSYNQQKIWFTLWKSIVGPEKDSLMVDDVKQTAKIAHGLVFSIGPPPYHGSAGFLKAMMLSSTGNANSSWPADFVHQELSCRAASNANSSDVGDKLTYLFPCRNESDWYSLLKSVRGTLSHANQISLSSTMNLYAYNQENLLFTL